MLGRNLKKCISTRIYFSLNVVVFSSILCFLYFQYRVSFVETGTGIKYKVLLKGNGDSISDFIKKTKISLEKKNSEIMKANADGKNVDDEKNVSKKIMNVNNLQFFISVGMNISYKGRILEYNDMRIYSYDEVCYSNYDGSYFECINMLKNVGDKYLFKIKKKFLPDDDIIKKTAHAVGDDDEILFEMTLKCVFEKSNFYDNYIMFFNENIKAMRDKLETEKLLIYMYLRNLGRDFSVVENYFVVIDDHGRGDEFKEKDVVEYDYSKKLHGERVSETTRKDVAIRNGIYDKKTVYSPKKVVIKANGPTFSNALVKFRRGGKGKIYYPATISNDKVKYITFYEVDIDVVGIGKKEGMHGKKENVQKK